MKKRILGLALALIMIISLLPVTTFADPATKLKIIVYDPNYTSAQNRSDISFVVNSEYASQRNEYITFVDVLDTDGTTVLGNKPAMSDTKPAEGTPYIHAGLQGTTLTITFNNIHYKRTASLSSPFMSIYKTDGGSEFDINIVLNGENKIEGGGAYIGASNVGTFNISGEGSLEMNISVASKQCIGHTGAGDMTISDATLKLNLTTASSGQNGGILNNGAITLNNANVEFNGQNSFGLRVGSATSDNQGTANVTVNNSNVKLAHAAGQRALIETNGTVTFNNSNVELIANENNAKILAKAPTITGTYSSQIYSVWNLGNNNYSEKAYTAAAFDDNIRYLKLVHQCVALADDGDCTTAVACACGKEAVAAKTHIAGANADDCTKDTMCGNAGCTKVFEAATATAHVPAADDGDCTTAIKCTNPGCAQVVTEGQAAHKDTRTDCSVAGTCANPGCTHAFTAGQHTGGTATCKAKAKCAICGQEYGQLAACTPAADDGDCTTDIKCSVCQKVTTKGQDAHKYTDKNDTTCDNAGCTKTRTVEGTENPKTGDATALVLVATLMVAAAAAFVTSKKFVR